MLIFCEGTEGAYWFGSCLSIAQARRAAPYTNATALQVAAGVLGGMVWAIQNPRRGLVEAGALDHELVLRVARPYLGTLSGELVPWRPNGELQVDSFLLDHQQTSCERTGPHSRPSNLNAAPGNAPDDQGFEPVTGAPIAETRPGHQPT